MPLPEPMRSQANHSWCLALLSETEVAVPLTMEQLKLMHWHIKRRMSLFERFDNSYSESERQLDKATADDLQNAMWMLSRVKSEDISK